MIRAAGIILFRRRVGEIEFLLMKNAEHGHWDFPKGHVEAGEDEMQAALRETREESGLAEIRIVPGFRESIFYRVDIKGKRAESGKKEVAYFLGEVPADAEPKLSDEHTDYKWLPFKQTISLIKFDNAREVLARAGGFLKSDSFNRQKLQGEQSNTKNEPPRTPRTPRCKEE